MPEYMVGVERPYGNFEDVIVVVKQDDWEGFGPGLMSRPKVKQHCKGDPMQIGVAYAKENDLAPVDVQLNVVERFQAWHVTASFRCFELVD